MSESNVIIRLAKPGDALDISILYHEIYHGSYTNSLMSNVHRLRSFLMLPETVWVVAEKDGRTVGSTAYETDISNRIAKAFGGVVAPECRGLGILEKMMIFGQEHLYQKIKTVDVIYATARGNNQAPQIVTEKLGYRKLGVLPNVHKTESFETHCLAALYLGSSLSERYTDFKLHPKLRGLYDIVREECGLGNLEITGEAEYKWTSPDGGKCPQLELIQAPQYVTYRFEELKKSNRLPFNFYPFHRPNVIATSPCQKLEYFLYLSEEDAYSTIIGMSEVSKTENYDFFKILATLINLLRDRGVRYVECIAPAHHTHALEFLMKSDFIPSAYFPAFQLFGNRRYDYVIFSRTFEVLDFRNTELAGVNKKFLAEYCRTWKENNLTSVLI